MKIRRLLVAVVVSTIVMTGPWAVPLGRAQSTAPMPPTNPAEAAPASNAVPVTPSRASYLTGEVSFWRPGAADWAPARINTPLAPGDAFYTGRDGHVEIQIGARAFVRAGENTQIGLDTQEPDFLQLRVLSGHAALDLRELPAGYTVELDTPNAAFTIEHAGYYKVDVAQESVTFAIHRGGRAMMTPPGGTAVPITANQQVVVAGAGSPIETGAAPPLTAWDRWNYDRTAYLLQPTATTSNVPAGVYGTPELEQYGSWRVAESYGAVWTPSTVPAGWVPYSTGRWIWDPMYGWTWLDDAPWGWAPYHHGRWVLIGNSWAWAPGPRIVRPVYSPALVVFLGGISVSIGRPVAWAPLGWGEPLLPWWGRRGFVGVPWWGGWGGPRVVNNIVVRNTTVVQPITVYRNVHVVNAVVGVPVDRFGHGRVQPTRFNRADVQQLTPVRGALAVNPVAASLAPASGSAPRPSPTTSERPIVATRPPHDVRPALRAHGLTAGPAPERPAPTNLVPSPARVATPDRPAVAGPSARPPSVSRPNAGGASAPPTPQLTPQVDRQTSAPDMTKREQPRSDNRPRGDVDRRSPQPALPPALPRTERAPEVSPQRPAPQRVTPPRAPEQAQPDRRIQAPSPDQGPPDRRSPGAPSPGPAPRTEYPAIRRDSPSARVERPARTDPPGRVERQDRSSREREWRGVAATNPGRAASAPSVHPRRDRLGYPQGAAH